MSNSFATPGTVAHQALLSMGFSRQEYWSGLPFPYTGDLPNPGIKPASPALVSRFFTTEPLGKSNTIYMVTVNQLVHIIKIKFTLKYLTTVLLPLFVEPDFYFCCSYPRLLLKFKISSVQLPSHVRLFATPRTAAHQASLSITNSWSLLKLVSTESVMPSNHLILYCALLLLPLIFPSIRVFSNESVLRIRWPNYWSFSFNISPSNEYSGLISFRMDWLDLLVVAGTLKSLLQHHSLKASSHQCSAFFTVQLSHPYMITGKTIALTRQTFAGKVRSLNFNILSRLVITFLPRSKHLLIS